MFISDSKIQLFSERSAMENHQRSESLRIWQRGEELSPANLHSGQNNTPSVNFSAERLDKVSLSTHQNIHTRQVNSTEIEFGEEDEIGVDLNIRLLRALFERITGRKFQLHDPRKFTPAASDRTAEDIAVNPAEGQELQNSGFGLEYRYHESHYEHEKTEVQAAGIVTTSDGREIDISLSVSMSREFYTEQNFEFRSGAALKDPLVVNYSGTAAQLGQRDFHFDIDSDGQLDQISFLEPGSGFLALDKNEDGTINDGSELFGAQSGDGFADLKEYDSDNNNWIDENDAIFHSLRIWSKNSQGKEQLVALGQSGVGAIYLGHIESLFSVKDSENEMLGQVKETGLAVMESGEVVSVQQLDLVV